jgi:hypothetical protein
MVPYAKLLAIKKRCGRKQLLTYKISWLRTMAYFNQEWSYQDLYNRAKRQNFDLDDQLILDSLRKFMEEVNTYSTNTNLRKLLIHMPKHFIWDNQEIWRIYKTREEVMKYKRKTVLEHVKKNRSNKKTTMVIEIVNQNQEISLIELADKLNGKVSRTTIIKILKQNNIILAKKSRLNSLIDRKFNELIFKKSDQLKCVLTYKLLGEWMGVSEQQIKRFMKDPDKKSRFLALNKVVRGKLSILNKTANKSRVDMDF